jgi:CHAT domain-containing protein/tetratricopeptide (TPR) repeat protein
MSWRSTLQTVALLAMGCMLSVGSAVRAQSSDVNDQLERLRNEGRFAEAITVLKRVISAREAQSGPNDPLLATLLNNLGELHYKLGLYSEAMPFYQRSLAIAERTIGLDNPATAITFRNLAIVYQLNRRFPEAEALYRKSIASLEKAANAQVQLASTLNNLAILYQDTNRATEAERVLQRVLSIYRNDLPPGHLYISTGLSNLGALYRQQGELAKAQVMYGAAISNLRQTLDRDHPLQASFLHNLGMLYVDHKDWPNAVATLREALSILQKQARRGAQSREAELSGLYAVQLPLQKSTTEAFINSAMQLVMVDQSQGVPLVREVFQAGQWRPSQASAALVQMSVRRMRGDGALARLVRERQDLVIEWQQRDKRLTDALVYGAPPTGRGDKGDRARLVEIDQRISAIDQRLLRDFPDYTGLTNPAPLEVPDVQALLKDNEAMIVFIETSSPTWVWAITKTEKQLSLVNLGAEGLAEQTAALRCGLDRLSWVDPSTWPDAAPVDISRKREQQKRYQRCRSLNSGYRDGTPLPFDLNRAHGVYKTLFGSFANAIAGKNLIIVPSPALMNMPFNVLVSDPPTPRAPGDFRGVRWLGTQQAITVLPSVATLAALRRNVQPVRATKPLLGVGNPLLEGIPGDPQQRRLAALARAKQSCSQISPPHTNAQALAAARSGPPPVAAVVRGAFADVAVLRQQLPLPETADELCDVSRRLGASDEDILLGERASETGLKLKNSRGELIDYKVFHFATHGLVAGDLLELSEPALILTPPIVASEEDDGLLTASEVAQLKLDADWVVLSACNTAAGGAEGGETLSGLARAFFHAGARAMLVTHWEIDSEAAVALTTTAFAAMKDAPGIGRAEAMRRSMARLAGGQSRPSAAHPSIWAAFALIGEGAARGP